MDEDRGYEGIEVNTPVSMLFTERLFKDLEQAYIDKDPEKVKLVTYAPLRSMVNINKLLKQIRKEYRKDELSDKGLLKSDKELIKKEIDFYLRNVKEDLEQSIYLKQEYVHDIDKMSSASSDIAMLIYEYFKENLKPIINIH